MTGGIIARPSGWGGILGFDEAEQGFMLATQGASCLVSYVPLHGAAQAVVETEYQDTALGCAPWSAFVYEP